MVTAHVHLTVATANENDPAHYTIEGPSLRAASIALSQLRVLGWSCTFDPARGLEEGIVEWTATKRFGAQDLARDEILTLPGWSTARPDRGDSQDLLFLAHTADSTMEVWFKLAFDDGIRRSPRLFIDEWDRDEIELAHASVSHRTLLADAASGAGQHDYLRVRRVDGTDVLIATAAAFRADPEATISQLVDALLGRG